MGQQGDVTQLLFTLVMQWHRTFTLNILMFDNKKTIGNYYYSEKQTRIYSNSRYVVIYVPTQKWSQTNERQGKPARHPVFYTR